MLDALGADQFDFVAGASPSVGAAGGLAEHDYWSPNFDPETASSYFDDDFLQDRTQNPDTYDYDPTKDYCGTGWNQHLVPDYFGGISIKFACYTHDQNYGPDSTMDRAEADAKLAKDIALTLVLNGVHPVQAAMVAGIYYSFVRAGGGSAYEGQGRNN